jgi:hypothetical protein
MPALLALLPRQVWIGAGVAAALLLGALLLIHHGAETQRADDAAAAAQAVTHDMEVRTDADRAAAAEPDPAERLRRDWGR